MKLRLGTRGSDLARTQARRVAGLLSARGLECETVIVETRGDRDTESPFEEVGATGIFARELEAALLEGRIDVAVHSHKDLPSELPAALVVAAIPEREDPRDLLIVRAERFDAEQGLLPVARGARVGTASARRAALLARLRPDLSALHLRGNVPTRLWKLQEGQADALILAAAGIERLLRAAAAGEIEPLPLEGLVRVPLDPDVFVPAPAQGALALEVRRGDARTLAAVQALDDRAIQRAVRAERELLARLEGGCQLSLGAWCRGLGPRERGQGQQGPAHGEDTAPDELELACALEREGTLRRARVRGADPVELAGRAHAALTADAPTGRLAGRRVLLTRAAEDNDRWGARLEELGARVEAISCLSTHVLEANGPALERALDGARWLAVASRRAVAAVLRLAGGLPDGVQVAAVGPGTERMARDLLERCDLVAPGGTGASLGLELAARGEGPVAVAAARGGRHDVEEALESAGLEARRVEVYAPADPAPTPTPEDGELPLLDALDAVVVASPSAVRGLLARARVPRGMPVITIGPTTAAAARDAGLLSVRVAPGRELSDLALAIERATASM